MLQALTLDVPPAQTKARSGSSTDPADAMFAGLMAQASLASGTPASRMPEPPRESSAEPRVAARGDAAEGRRVRGAQDRVPAPNPERANASDPAKAAAEVPAKQPTAEQPTAGQPAAGQPAAEQPAQDTNSGTAAPKEAKAPEAQSANPQSWTPQLPEGAAPAASGQEAKAAGPAAAAQGAAAPGAEAPPIEGVAQAATAQKAQAPAESAKKAAPVPQLREVAEGQDVAPSKAALTELLYLPKAEIQTPKLHPEALKASPLEVPKPLPPSDSALKPAPEDASRAEARDETAASAKPAPTPEPTTAAGVRHEAHPQPASAPKAAATGLELMPTAETGSASAPSVMVEVPALARSQPMMAQIEGSIRWVLQNKVQSAELQLHPESLGRVVIQLRVEGQEVHARLWASETASAAMLQDHKGFLESSLKAQGLHLGSFDLQSGTRGNGTPNAPRDQAPPPAVAALPEAKQEMPTSSPLLSAEAHQIEVFA